MLGNFDGNMRTIRPDDLEFLIELRNDRSTWAYLGDPTFLDIRSQQKWYQNMSDDLTRQYFIYENNAGDRVGMVRMDEINHLHRNIRVGGDIAREYRGQGHGTNMYELIKEYCFDFLNMHRIWLLVTEYNEPAIKLYLNTGFKEEGKYKEGFRRYGKYYDYICMSMLDFEYEKDA